MTQLVAKLKKTEGITVREMVFSHGLSDAPAECDGVTLAGHTGAET
ncbi:MAG: hypothetical protein MZV63_05585 [Marinilabiliales bacterium]|nr:hypothetical protein [Marinilabiliales bacterium]